MVVRNCWEFFKSKKPVNFNFLKIEMTEAGKIYMYQGKPKTWN